MHTREIVPVVPTTLWSVTRGDCETRCIVDHPAALADIPAAGGIAAVSVNGRPVCRHAFADVAELITVTADFQLAWVPAPVERA